ncbi:MAG TPA: hypothetical protein VN736_00965 [Candidatus Limnocylindrales bacterium]|nr:hypothetical protein [Candidatus Limnocylindrales bacterium]
MRTCAVSAMLASGIFAQGQRQATMVGGGTPDRGKCTIEVVVDGSAQVEVRGTSATLRTLSGQPAQWRRFECTGQMPANAPNFRFAGVDGRGKQQLMRDPRNGGVAVVQIDDPEGGAEGYTFDLFWDTRGGGGPGTYGSQPGYQPDQRNAQGNYPGQQGYPDRADRQQEPPNGGGWDRDEHYRPGYRDSDYYHRYGHGFGMDEAIRVCQDAVKDQAVQRFGRADIHFHGTRIDDRPGRNDVVSGTLDVHRGPREERFGFSCSVNFDNGRVRSADLDRRPLADDPRWH